MDLLAALTRIGFTEYEAKVYVALLSSYPATGYQISKHSGVPRSMVYETLSRLRSRGAVMETAEERASLYRPVPPGVLLDRHQEELNTLISGLRDGLEKRYRAQEDSSVWLLAGRSAVLAYAQRMIQSAGQELYLVLADREVDELRAAVTAACARGVDVNTLLTGHNDLPCGQVLRHPPLESEIQGLTGTLLVVSDREEVLIADQGREVSATITRNPSLLLIARQFVWMEMLTQRLYARIGPDLLQRLDPPDRRLFESLGPPERDGAPARRGPSQPAGRADEEPAA